MQAVPSSGARHSASTSGEFLPVSALRAGDVLLSCGAEALSILIRRLDGGDYSHSAVWDGAYAVDATEGGVVRRDLQKDMDVQWFVDAYRWHSPPPGSIDLGDAPYPYQPVITRNDRIVDAKTKFAYDELLMLALVVAVSKEPQDKWLRRSVRLLLSRAEEWIHEHIFSRPGTVAMTCAETVAVSFDEAVPPQYGIVVEVDQTRHYETIANARPRERAEGVRRAISSYEAVRQRYAELVATAAPATVRGLQVLDVTGRGMVTKLPAGCVTPHDLQSSPSLRRLGRLSEKPAAPPAASESSWRLFLEVVREYWRKLRTLARQ